MISLAPFVPIQEQHSLMRKCVVSPRSAKLHSNVDTSHDQSQHKVFFALEDSHLLQRNRDVAQTPVCLFFEFKKIVSDEKEAVGLEDKKRLGSKMRSNLHSNISLRTKTRSHPPVVCIHRGTDIFSRKKNSSLQYLVARQNVCHKNQMLVLIHAHRMEVAREDRLLNSAFRKVDDNEIIPIYVLLKMLPTDHTSLLPNTERTRMMSHWFEAIVGASVEKRNTQRVPNKTTVNFLLASDEEEVTTQETGLLHLQNGP